jgi:acetyl esterase/lipase
MRKIVVLTVFAALLLAAPANAAIDAKTGVIARPDHAYVSDGLDKHMLDVFSPRTGVGYPVFVFVHGGGWTAGDRRNYAFIARAIAAEGIVVVVPSYRLWPTTDAVGMAEDIGAASAWTFEHIRDYGGDPRHVVIGGHSAGGHLAALVGFDSRYLRDSGATSNRFAGVALLSGTYDLRPANFTDDALFGSTMQKRMQLSPILYLNDATPPVLAVCASDEAPISCRLRNQLAAAISEAHGHVRIFDAIGRTHISEIVDIAEVPTDALRAALAAFIRDPH